MDAAAHPTNQVGVILHMAERQLLNAFALDQNSIEVNDALGRFYIKTHQPAKARAHLLRIYTSKPDTRHLSAS